MQPILREILYLVSISPTRTYHFFSVAMKNNLYTCYLNIFISQSISSVAQSCPTLCNPMNCKASLSITDSRSTFKLMSMELVMSSSHLILCHPLLLLPSIPPSIRDFSNESNLHMRWPKYWSFSFTISPSNEHPELISLG